MEAGLNLDIAGSVSELELLMKKVLPKKILYKLVLGKGLDFDGYRDFSFNDDAANIDWRASVRAKKLLLKQYIEERDLKFIFFVDVSENMIFGSTEKLKCEYTAELSAALSHLILSSGDRFGFVLFNNKIVKIKIPEQGKKQFEMFVHELSEPSNYGGISSLKQVLSSMIPTMDKTTSVVFLVSDFLRVDDSYKESLETLSALFETVAIIVRDPLDLSFPNLNKEIVIEDPETGEKLLINPRVAKKIYEKNASLQLNKVKDIFRDYGIDFLEVHTDENFAEQFAVYFQERIRKGRGGG